MPALVYLLYGDNEQYYWQAKYSILSAWYCLGERLDTIDIIVCTDHPKLFANWPVIVEVFDWRQLIEWAGEYNYLHRAKNCALQLILKCYKYPLIFVDTDIYFKQSPALLFSRVTPSFAVLYEKEGLLLSTRHFKFIYQELSKCSFSSNLWGEYRVEPVSAMWNSGIIGINYSHLPALEKALWLIDQMTHSFFFHTIEQFAISESLRANYKLKPANDVCHHYYRTGPKRYITEQIKLFFSRFSEKNPKNIVKHVRKLQRRRSLSVWLKDKTSRS